MNHSMNVLYKSDGARLDIGARGFWTSGQKAFFDVRVFNPLAKRYRNTELKKCYAINEKEKKKSYNERILNIEQGSFTPLVMTANGGFGRECSKFYSRLAELIATKRKKHVSIVSAWVKRKVMFSLINSVILCIRGSRSVFDNNAISNSINNNIDISESITNINT